MAKIPRINQGDRPSATYNPTLDTSVANIMGSIGDVAGEALATVTAEEMAERQRLSMALAAKQRIVDESNAGMVELEFEDTSFKTLAALERDYADTPEVIPQKYTEIMREQAAAIRNREDINDTVKLMAVKGAESILSSGLRQAYSISSNLQTKQVKGNRIQKDIYLVNSARDLTSPQQLQVMFEGIDADPEFDHLYGKNAADERYEVKLRAAKAQLETFSETHPLTARKMLDSGKGFYGKYLKENDFTSLREKTKRDALHMADTRMFETLTGFGERGSLLLRAATAGEANASVISTERAKVEADRRRIIDNLELSADAKKAQFAEIEKHNKFIDAVELWQSRTTHSKYIGDDEVPAEVWVKRNEIFSEDNPSLSDLMEYRKMVLDVANDKRMSPAKATTLMQEIALATPAAVQGAKDNTGYWFWFKNDVQAGTRAARREIEINTSDSPLSPKAESRVYSEYVRLYTDAQKQSGKAPTRADLIKMAKQAFYIATDTPMPKGLR